MPKTHAPLSVALSALLIVVLAAAVAADTPPHTRPADETFAQEPKTDDPGEPVTDLSGAVTEASIAPAENAEGGTDLQILFDLEVPEPGGYDYPDDVTSSDDAEAVEAFFLGAYVFNRPRACISDSASAA